MAGAVAAAGTGRLPPLREDLRLLPGAPTKDGAPTWTLHDPARNRFFRIGWLQFEILSRWGLGKAADVARSVAEETTIKAQEADVLSLLQFFGQSGLFAPSGADGTRRLMAEVQYRRLSPAMWLLKNYLFLRVRLLGPDRFLRWLVPFTGFIYTRGFAVAIAALAVLGLHLVGQQWDAYWNQFLDLFSLEGALLVGAALFGAKIVHEFGHGLTARHFGCRVPSMGVALLVMLPVLWTDTTDAWRLTDRRKRLMIDAAGMGAELVLAVFATLAWTVLPDGPLRTAAFLLSSSTWIVTVVINVNPLMRFDGYYLLSDSLDVPNLQVRGFALARWWLREAMFGMGDKPPEALPRRLRRIIVAYGLAAMVYRFFLFLGIAATVYHIGFKVLGLFLMTIELWWFTARPVFNELLIWGRGLRSGKASFRALLTFAIVGLVIAALVVPWRGTVSAPALARSGHEATLYTDRPGRLLSFPESGTRVTEGEVVFRLESPTLDGRRESVRAKAAALRVQIEGQAFDADSAFDIDVTWQQFGQALAELRSLEAERTALDVHAPFAGIVRDVSASLRQGQWMGHREALAMLVDPSDRTVEAYVAETDLARVHVGAAAWFYPANTEDKVELRVAELSVDSVRVLEDKQLASPVGGPVAARREPNGAMIPANTVYRVLLEPLGQDRRIDRRMTGTVVIDGDKRSVMDELWRRGVSVVMRESNL